ncbi:hypothetical protein GDO81_028137 [Engystomops pustulosus]|uniref:Secreted protein n=1 Tax=Engystomops pustulosus TaxID=76066 RepID=A0AAV6YF09_ENGPU|nr:hypothetical protein GDO81_028137 [Engystomops pustulosus]
MTQVHMAILVPILVAQIWQSNHKLHTGASSGVQSFWIETEGRCPPLLCLLWGGYMYYTLGREELPTESTCTGSQMEAALLLVFYNLGSL